jgi:hypothetical protein
LHPTERNIVEKLETKSTEDKQAAENLAADEFESAFAEFSKAREGGDAHDLNADDLAAENSAATNSSAASDDAKHTGNEANENSRNQKQDEPGDSAKKGAESKGDAVDDPKNDLLKRLEAAEGRSRELEHKLRSHAGRQSALQRKNRDLQTQLEALTSKAGTEKSDRPLYARLKQLQEEFPEIAETLQQTVDDMRSEFQETLAPLKDTLTPLKESEQRREFDEATEEVRKAYPNFLSEIQTREFIEWLMSQPPEVQSLADSRDPNAAIAMLGYYNAGKNPRSSSTAQSASASPPASTSLSAQQATPVSDIRSQRSAALQRHAGASVRDTSATSIADAPDDFENAFSFFSKRRERQMERARL